jgi:multimeric flavodoxin WrbA
MKTLLINGSPNKNGGTFAALKLVTGALQEEGIETEILHIPDDPIIGCAACFACRKGGGARCLKEKNDIVNIIIEKMEKSDALVLGSPVYYASPNGQLLSALDRVFFAGSSGSAFLGKPAAVVCTARRAGTSSTLDVLQKYFTISGMPIAASNYWPMVHGGSEDAVYQDAEGVQIVTLLGKNIAWLLKCLAAGKEKGMEPPVIPGGKKIYTNFIRR